MSSLNLWSSFHDVCRSDHNAIHLKHTQCRVSIYINKTGRKRFFLKFEIIVNSHVAVRNGRKCCVSFTQFPPAVNMLQNCSANCKQEVDMDAVEMQNIFITSTVPTLFISTLTVPTLFISTSSSLSHPPSQAPIQTTSSN